jgi:hypothetical protein
MPAIRNQGRIYIRSRTAKLMVSTVFQEYEFLFSEIIKIEFKIRKENFDVNYISNTLR